nr:fimbria/pilus outer membrane usher protein [uncultured Hydrogenophaga sp.]
MDPHPPEAHSRPGLTACLLGVAVMLLAQQASAERLPPGAGDRSASAGPVLRWVDVRINGHALEGAMPLVEIDGQFLAPADALAAWQVAPQDSPLLIDGRPHHSLQAWQPRLLAATQTLLLSIEAESFVAQRLPWQSPRIDSPAIELHTAPGLALDYSFNLDRDRAGSQASTLTDLRAFGLWPQTVLHHTQLWRQGGTLPGQARAQRLDTALRHADPEGLWRTTVGDTLSCGGELAPTVRMAGLQLRTDFGLQPDRVQYPLPLVQGSAQVPSGVDLLINDRPAGNLSVGPGRFLLDSLPAVTGAGEIRLVQRDVQGIEQVRTVPFYASPRLLRPGVREQCAELGRLRLNYGLPGDRYQGSLAALAWREGITDTLTGLARVESGSTVQNLHLATHWVPARLGVVSLQWTGSRSTGRQGQALRLGLERVTPTYHLSARTEIAGKGVRQIDGSLPPARRSSLFGGWTWGRVSTSVGQVWQRSAAGVDQRVFTASAQQRIGGDWQMGLSALRREQRWSVAVMFTRALGRDISLAARLQTGADAGVALQAQRHEPETGGVGWRLQGGSGANRAVAGWSWLGDLGRLELQAARAARGDTAERLTWQGGLIWLDERPVAGRALGDGVVARIEVAGLPGVGVQLNRREVAVTDAQGRAWVHGLQPWEDNIIGISPERLPMDLLVSLHEVRIRPPGDTVVNARFPTRRSRAALLRVQYPDGRPVAPGARARLGAEDPGAGVPFGLSGEVFLGDLQDRNRLLVEGPAGVCQVDFDLPPEAGVQPTLGPLVCRELRP